MPKRTRTRKQSKRGKEDKDTESSRIEKSAEEDRQEVNPNTVWQCLQTGTFERNCERTRTFMRHENLDQ